MLTVFLSLWFLVSENSLRKMVLYIWFKERRNLRVDNKGFAVLRLVYLPSPEPSETRIFTECENGSRGPHSVHTMQSAASPEKYFGLRDTFRRFFRPMSVEGCTWTHCSPPSCKIISCFRRFSPIFSDYECREIYPDLWSITPNSKKYSRGLRLFAEKNDLSV